MERRGGEGVRSGAEGREGSEEWSGGEGRE